MVEAYILIQTEVGRALSVTRDAGNVDGVVDVDGVTGPYDVIARARADDLDAMAKGVVLPIQEIDGVTRTLTCPVIQF